MHVHIPNSAFLGNIDSFIQSLDTSDCSILTLGANKRWISIHPVVLCMIACLALQCKKVHCEPLQATSSHYLERMGLFTYLGLPQSTLKLHDPTGRFIPLTTITNSTALSSFVTDMIPLLHVTLEQALTIRYIISELLRNVLEHAHSHGGIVCAQYYQKSNTIRIGIVDNGVGIKSSIAQSHKVGNYLDALLLALTPGITGTTAKEGGTAFNAGAGLFFIKSIAKMNGNFFFIYSGDTMYKLLKNNTIRLFDNPLKDRHSIKQQIPFWQGTVVGIDVCLDHTPAFSSLLDSIRDTYIDSIRQRKKHKRPQFI